MNHRILIIDDNQNIHDDIKKILSSTRNNAELDDLGDEIFGNRSSFKQMEQITIDSAHQGSEGVEMGLKAWTEGAPYSVAFVDVRMPPGIDGIKTIQELKIFDKELQFVIITAYSDYSWKEIQSAVNGGDSNLLILKKPFDSIEIRQLISALTTKWSLSKREKEHREQLQCINFDLAAEILERKKLEAKHVSLLQELTKRLKELNCLYELTKITQDASLSLYDIFNRFILLIPPAWQFPECTCAEMRYKSDHYRTDNFKKTQWRLSSDIVEKNEIAGSIEVFYTEQKPQAFEGPFLKEERALLNALSRQIGKTIERVNTQIQLRENEERIRLIMDSTAEGIFGLDLEGRCIFCNRACINLLGYSDHNEMLGKKIHDMLHHTKADGSNNPFDECHIFNTTRYHREVHIDTEVFWTKNNKSIQVEYWSYPIFKHDEIKGAVVTFIDISQRISAQNERKQLLTQLQQAQKMEAIGTLAGGIAHDFNNILFIILGNIELLLSDIPNDSPLRESLETSLKSALKAKDLIKQILTFSRKERHGIKAVDISRAVKESLKLLNSTIPSHIEIHHSIEKKCGYVHAEPTHIHQIVMNLCSNAYHAMEISGGSLTISLGNADVKAMAPELDAAPKGRYVCLSIADTGIGIENTLLKKIFDPYYTTKGVGKGTGLGLSVVHGIVNSYNGYIHTSSQPGKGTEFKIYLPCSDKPLNPVDAKAKKIMQKGDEHILVVDDEISILSIMEKMLHRLGYTVTCSVSAKAALEIFSNSPERFDLVITDLSMPKLKGDLMAEELLKIKPALPIILCTGFGDSISLEHAKKIGIKHFLLKPISLNELSETVSGIFRHHKSATDSA